MIEAWKATTLGDCCWHQPSKTFHRLSYCDLVEVALDP